MKLHAIFVASFVSLVAAAALGPMPVRAEPHVLRFADGVDLTSLDPLNPQAAPNNELNDLTMAYLFRYGPAGFEPEYAATVPTQRNGGISKDGKTITIHLRNGARWSDGSPLTSADVAFSFALIKDPKTNSVYRDGFQFVERVETPDATTAIVHLTHPYGTALEVYFSSRSAPLFPKHLLEGISPNGGAYQALPTGSGPFRYVKWLRGDKVVLEPNPYYVRGTPKLKRIEYDMNPNTSSTITEFRTGRVDLMLLFPYGLYQQVAKDPGVSAVAYAGTRPGLFVFNLKDQILGDLAVRRALRLGLDRPGIIARSYLGAGVLSESLVTANDPEAAKIPLVAYDPSAARKALDAAGWQVGSGGIRTKNGRRLTVDVAAATGAVFVDQTVELLRANWSAIGVDVATKRYPLSLMFATADEGGIINGGKFGVVLFSFGEIKGNELGSFFLCRDVPPSGSNYSRFCDPKLDELTDRADATYDPAVAGRLYRRVETTVSERVPIIVVGKRNEYDIYRDGVVGAKRPPFAAFADPMTIDVVK